MSWCPFPGFRTVFVKLMITLTFTSEISEILRAAPLNVLDQRQQAAGVTDQFIQEGNNIWELGPMIPLLLPAVQHQLVQGDWAAHGRGQTVALLDGQDHLENRGRRWGVTAENKPIDFRSVQIWSLKSEINKIFWKVSTLKCDCTDRTVKVSDSNEQHQDVRRRPAGPHVERPSLRSSERSAVKLSQSTDE